MGKCNVCHINYSPHGIETRTGFRYVCVECQKAIKALYEKFHTT